MPDSIDRVRARELELLQREGVYQQILNAIADMVLVKGAHSRILWANTAFRDYYGMSNDELQRLVDAPFNAPDHTQQYIADDLHVFTTGETLEVPAEPVTRHDGAVNLFHTVKSAIRDDDRRVRMTVGVSRNIGETLALREQVLRSREQLERDRLSVFAAQLPGFLFQVRVDDVGHRFTFVSARVAEYYNVAPRALLDDARLLYTHVASADVVGAELTSAFAAGATTPNVAHVHRVCGADGVWRWMELLATARVEADGTVTFHGYAHDVSARHRIEEEREALIDALKARNTEMEQFTYTISHDLKSPLVTIRGFVGGIEEDLRNGRHDRALADLQRVRAAAEKMSRMLAELLELSRVGRVAHPATTFAFGDLVDEVRELLTARLTAARADLAVTGRDVRLHADHMRMVQVLQNLVENAVKAMAKQDAPVVRLSCVVDDNAVHIRVADSGIGIDPAHHQRVFGLFEKLDARSEGTGVGLALVKSIVEVHRGRVWVESAGAGQGSTFHVMLPAASTD